jgi:cytochrome P450
MFITVILFVIVLIIYLIHVHRSYAFFQQMGIDGPRPTFFIGNISDFARTKRISLSIHQWTNQFGRIYGYFEGHTPVLVISDPDILDQIFRKLFSKFHSRRQFPLEDRSTRHGIHLFSATGDQWRRQRAILNPTFSPLKIKRMLPMIDQCLSRFMSNLSPSMDIDIYRLYKSLTMDLIWRCCFGLETDMQINPNNVYLLRSQQVFARESSTYVTTLLSIFIPELQDYWIVVHGWMNMIKVYLRRYCPWMQRFVDDDPNEWLKMNVEQLIEQASTTAEQTDLLHSMLDAMRQTNDSIAQVRFFAFSIKKRKDIEVDLLFAIDRIDHWLEH